MKQKENFTSYELIQNKFFLLTRSEKTSILINVGLIAQLVEHLTFNQRATGSNPVEPTKKSPSSRGLGHRPFTATTRVQIP